MSIMTLIPNEDQQHALDAVRDWFASNPYQPFVLGGLAGTGKTALLPMIHKSMRPLRIRYVCPTWKAAHVLSTKLRAAGVYERATSIHNLIYNPRGVLHEEDCGFWQNAEAGCNMTPPCRKLCWEFDPKDRPQLLVVDEASMVDTRIREDIERLGSPTLYVGDHGQLPPIIGPSIFDDHPPDARLETIQRQALDSPIIPLSRVVRAGDRSWLDKAQQMGFTVLEAGSKSARRYDLRTAEPPHSDPNTVFITSTNAAVDRLNRLTRRTLGRGPDVLVPGDLVMAQNNSREIGIYNGQQGVITEVGTRQRRAEIRMETGVVYEGPLLVKGVDEIPAYAEVPVVRHSYAVTCHKAQGSEFRNVIVFLNGGRMEDSRWLYTAITRATHNLTFVRA